MVEPQDSGSSSAAAMGSKQADSDANAVYYEAQV